MKSKNGSAWSVSASGGTPSTSDHKQPLQPSVGEDSQATVNEADPERKSVMQSKPPAEQKPAAGMLERSLQARIGRQLRAIFADVADEPVPKRFSKLLEELAAREKQR